VFYGLCLSYRAELREKYLPAPVEVEAEKFEPKVNETLNAVATKE